MTVTLREKLMHYAHDLDCGADLKQGAIATIEHIAQYMDEDELLHHSRPLALAYLALTEDAAVPVVRCKDCKHLVAVNVNGKGIPTCRMSGMEVAPAEFCSRGEKERRC